jgi:hypothetical protein
LTQLSTSNNIFCPNIENIGIFRLNVQNALSVAKTAFQSNLWTARANNFFE